jgi:hypothetical protein
MTFPRLSLTPFALALAAALPSLAALLVYGVVQTPDSGGYLDYAREIAAGSVPSGAALLTGDPISLYRMGGFPALLAALQGWFPVQWALVLVAGQIGAQAAVAVAAWRTALRLGAGPVTAVVAALLPAIGFAVVANVCVLTDAFYSAAVAGAAFALVLRPDARGALLAGVLLAAATSFREATIFYVLAFLPLAALSQRRLLCMALVLLPCWGVAGAQVGWNISRGAGPVLTTSKQIVMVQALLPLIADHVPVYADDPVLAAAATNTIDVAGYARIDVFEQDLRAQGLTPQQIAKRATAAYARAWRLYPGRMLGATVADFRTNYLYMTFQPQETVATLQVYTTGQRPDWNRLNVLTREARAGSGGAIGWMALGIGCEALGVAITLLALVSPWCPRGNWTLRALWCLPVALVALYLPVHLEVRYLTPMVPVLCVLAAARPRKIQETQGGATGESLLEVA